MAPSHEIAFAGRRCSCTTRTIRSRARHFFAPSQRSGGHDSAALFTKAAVVAVTEAARLSARRFFLVWPDLQELELLDAPRRRRVRDRRLGDSHEPGLHRRESDDAARAIRLYFGDRCTPCRAVVRYLDPECARDDDRLRWRRYARCAAPTRRAAILELELRQRDGFRQLELEPHAGLLRRDTRPP